MSSILIVDDDDDLRDLLSDALRSDGHQVSSVTDGEVAWAWLNSRDFDLVVVDVVIPGLDGLQLVARCRADARHSSRSIVVVSARAFPADIAAGIAAGADRYVTKPFSPRALRGVVRELLGP